MCFISIRSDTLGHYLLKNTINNLIQALKEVILNTGDIKKKQAVAILNFCDSFHFV